MRKHCISCGSEKLLRYPYYTRVHLPLHKNIARIVLPYFDRFIPESAARLKRVSSSRKRGKNAEDAVFNNMDVLVCASCGYGTFYKPPCEAALFAYFRDHYWNKKSKLDYWLAGSQSDYKDDLRAASQFEFVKQHLPKELISILEIGAGAAWSLQLLRDNYPQAKLYACEPAKQMNCYYEKRNIQRIAEFFPFKSKIKFDYIHGSYWLSYVYDLKNTIIALQDLLSEKGLLFIEVPNCVNAYWRWEKDHRPCIHFFTMNSLVSIFEKFRFKCIKVGEFGNTYQECSLGIKPSYEPRKEGCSIRALFEVS